MKKILTILGAVIALSIIPLAGMNRVWRTAFPGMTDAGKAQYNAAARAGVPVIEAIYEYRNATELFPETLQDLGRVSAIRVDTNRWSYEWRNDFAMIEYIGREADGLFYIFDDRDSGWFVGNRIYYGMTIDAPADVPSPPERTQAEKHRLIVEEIERRIARDGMNPVHPKGLISHRIKAGDLAGALANATRMHERKLVPWWELQILARLLHRLGEENWAERKMRTLAEREPGFLPFFYLAWFYREAGQKEAALQALRRASVLPFRGMEWDHYADKYYFWLAATYAYREREPDLVLAVCDAWDANEAKRGYGTPEPHALRAAALLAKGRITQAQSGIDRAIQIKEDRAIWAENLDALSSAIQRSDEEYRWNPASDPYLDCYELLITYR